MATTQTISVTRALRELKTLDKRINDGIGRLTLVGVYVDGKPAYQNFPASPEALKDAVKGQLESVQALINNRDAIKNAIVRKNAETDIVVGGVTMKVADAIEKKASIDYRKTLLARLDGVLNAAAQTAEKIKAGNDAKVQELLKGASEAKTDPAKMEAFKSLYPDPVIVDPSKTQEVADALRKEIEDFENDVDAALSEKNAVTMIEISLNP